MTLHTYENTNHVGAGEYTCECGLHRERCIFGRQHTWSLAYVDHMTGRPLPAPRFHCMNCDSYCAIPVEDF